MKKAIVLGGTRPHITLIQKLKDRGYYVILLDYLESPIAKEYADEHIRESTLDKDLVLKIAKEQLILRKVILQATYMIEQMNFGTNTMTK